MTLHVSSLCRIAGCIMLMLPLPAMGAIDFYGGGETGTYYHLSQDLKHLLAEEQITIQAHATDGSIDNIRQIAKNNQAAIGLVQADVLNFMRRSNNSDTKKLADNIRMIMPLHQEEVHILASTDIKRLSDLQGKRVVVGEEGSGNMLTAVNLLAISDIRVGETIRLSPPEGVLAVLEGEADAVIYVSGKPVKLFKNIEDLETTDGKKFLPLLKRVHFIPVSSPAALAEYTAATITPKDYRFVKETIPTVAVQAILVTGSYTQATRAEQCSLVQKVGTLIRSQLAHLQKVGHAKWHDVDLSSPVALWKKDRCSWPDTSARINSKKAAH